MKTFNNLTAQDLIIILKTMPQNKKISLCGSDTLHIAEIGEYIVLDHTEIEEEYHLAKAYLESMKDAFEIEKNKDENFKTLIKNASIDEFFYLKDVGDESRIKWNQIWYITDILSDFICNILEDLNCDKEQIDIWRDDNCSEIDPCITEDYFSIRVKWICDATVYIDIPKRIFDYNKNDMNNLNENLKSIIKTVLAVNYDKLTIDDVLKLYR